MEERDNTTPSSSLDMRRATQLRRRNVPSEVSYAHWDPHLSVHVQIDLGSEIPHTVSVRVRVRIACSKREMIRFEAELRTAICSADTW